MQKIALLAGVMIIGGIGVYLANQDNTVEVIKEVSAPTIIDNTPEWATDTEAVEAAQAVIRRKELEADKTRLEAEISSLKADLEAIDKELGTY